MQETHNTLKTATTSERRIADAGDTRWDRDARESTAIGKRTIADAGNTCEERDACEATATVGE